MNTKTLKEVAKWMMISGGTLFAGGFGLNFICNRIDNAVLRSEHLKELNEIEKSNLVSKNKLEEEALAAKAAREKILAQKLESMDAKAFAKYQAEQTARANENVLASANKIKSDAESELAKIRMECKDEIASIRSECLAKIDAANEKRDEAIAKYERIDSLFTNKKEILKAKAALEEAANKESETRKSRNELLESIKDLLEE